MEYYNIRAIMQHDYHDKLAHHYHINLHDYMLTHDCQLHVLLLYFMLSAMMQRVLLHMFVHSAELCHYTFTRAAVLHYNRSASNPTAAARPDTMKNAHNPMTLLAPTLQEPDRVYTTFDTRRKQAQEHCEHMMLCNTFASDKAKKKYYQSLQETLREATREFHSEKRDIEEGFFSSLPPDIKNDFEKVWR